MINIIKEGWMRMPYNILLVDDHQAVLDGLSLIVETDSRLQCIGKASNGIKAIDLINKEKVNKEKVDLILMDINMPELNGIDATKRIKEIQPDIKIIGLSMIEEVTIIKQIVKNGADGFLLKNSGKDEILQAIHKVLDGGQYFDYNILEKMIKSNDQKSPNITPIKLSRREKEIVKLIIDEHTTKEIAAMLFISFGTVETHRRNIINKLGVRNTAGIVRATLEFGLLD